MNVKSASDTIYPLDSFDSCLIIFNYVRDEYATVAVSIRSEICRVYNRRHNIISITTDCS